MEELVWLAEFAGGATDIGPEPRDGKRDSAMPE
jgi:hypothetical protein